MIPPFLYHYTSSDTLRLILKNKTIRFTRLDYLNDLLEGVHPEFNNISKHVYASSWTSVETESIPMWKIYSSLKEGVRIKMPIDLFSFDDGLKIKKSKNGYWHLRSILNKSYEVPLNEQLPPFENRSKKAVNLNASNLVFGPSKIEYLATANDICAKAVVRETSVTHFESYAVDLSTIGLEKLQFWSFENEFRFRIIFPEVFCIYGSKEVISAEHYFYVDNQYIDIEFNEKALSSMEVLFAPNFDKQKKDGLKAYIESLGNDCVFNDSSLKIR